MASRISPDSGSQEVVQIWTGLHLAVDHERVSAVRMPDVYDIAGRVECVTGVETEAELNYLKNQNCEFFQGYYFSRPKPFAQFLLEVS